MSTESTTEILRFGPFELDPGREELRKSGLTLRLPHQPLRLLLLLARRPGEIVTREEIQREIWGSETYVDFDQGINTAIRHIRYHLGDNPEAPRYIRTLPRRGYTFIAPVDGTIREAETVAAPVKPHSGGRRPRSPSLGKRAVAASLSLMIVIVVAATAGLWLVRTRRLANGETARHRIVVLPFRVIGNGGNEVDARSFGEELRATLGTLPRRHVALLDPRMAHRATLRIEGTMQRSAAGVRVIVSGTDTKSGAQLWSLNRDRPFGRASGLPIETAHGVLKEVAVHCLPPPMREPAVRTKVSSRALELYRNARTERARSIPDRDWDRARILFEGALREEPRFAEALSGLSDLWAERTLTLPMERTHAAAQTRHYAHRALKLQPHNGEAHSSLGVIALQYEYDLAGAEEMFRRAVADEGDMGFVHYNLAVALTARGHFDEALRELAFARQLDPLDFDLHPFESNLYLYAGRYEDAIAGFRAILAIRPESRNSLWGILSAHVAQGRWAAATEMAWTILGTPHADRVEVPATKEGFREIYRRLEKDVYTVKSRGVVNDYSIGVYYAELGELDRAFEMLTRAADSHAPTFAYLLVDPRVDSLRNDPRFSTLVARLR